MRLLLHWILEWILLVRLNLSHALQYMPLLNFRTELNCLALGFYQHVWHSNCARCPPDLFSINDLLLDREEKFPKQIQLGSRRVVWNEQEVAKWMEDRMASRWSRQVWDLNTKRTLLRQVTNGSSAFFDCLKSSVIWIRLGHFSPWVGWTTSTTFSVLWCVQHDLGILLHVVSWHPI